MEDRLKFWHRRDLMVVDKKTGFPRQATFSERLIVRDEARRYELRATAYHKKCKARERKRRGHSRWKPTDGVNDQILGPRRRYFGEDIGTIGLRLYAMLTDPSFRGGSGQHNQSWKTHRRTKWRIRRPSKRHFEMIRFRREAHA